MSSPGIELASPGLRAFHVVCRMESRELVPPANVIDGPLITFLRGERTTDYIAVRG
jgi:hypothetical protein